VGEGTPTGTAGFITVNDGSGTPRLFAPLQTLAPNNPLSGGFGFLDLTDGGATFHPGSDLNAGGSCDADLGLPVVAMLGGIVRAALPWDGHTPGEGNHLWYEVDDPLAPAPTWVHHDHLQSFAVDAGTRVAPGELLGVCGRSGGWSCAHLHSEWLPGAPPEGWWQWPYGWSREAVQAFYYSPADWWRAASAKVQGASPEAVMAILSGAQAAAVQAVVWAGYWEPAEADFAIPTSWRAEWQAGRWRGAPLSSEQPVPEDTVAGKPGGSWRLFEGGAAVWLPGQDVSWNG
jgi:hypothetical protein